MDQIPLTIETNLMEVVAACLAIASLMLDSFVIGCMHQKKKDNISKKEDVL